MKNLLTRLKKELQEKNQQPKQSLIDLELADYDKTVQNLKEQLINKEKDLQDLRDELSNTTNKYACLKLEIKNLEQQKSQSDERANKFKALLDIAKRELQNAKDLEIQRYQNEDNVRSLIETLQNQLDNNKVLINQLNNEKQQLTGKGGHFFAGKLFENFFHFLEKLNNQSESTQKTMNLLEQNLRIAKHDLDIAKQD
jgi:RNAse (barnase) inhibitor barstar